MTIFEDLTEQIYGWLEDGQDPESIRRDIMLTVDEAIASAKDIRYVNKIATLLLEYCEESSGELATDNLDMEDYQEMATAILLMVNKAFKNSEDAPELNKEAADSLNSKVKSKSQEEIDAEILDKWLNEIENGNFHLAKIKIYTTED